MSIEQILDSICRKEQPNNFKQLWDCLSKYKLEYPIIVNASLAQVNNALKRYQHSKTC